MDDREILSQIRQLVDDEHELRERLQRGDIDSHEERTRLSQLERSLDQCWDLLRQRRAKVSAGEDPGLAKPRPVDEVENYRQ
jgi:hypothetical protein